MTVSYNGLWKMLIDKKMLKKDLAAELNISSATMARMGKGENVSLDVLQKICDYMDIIIINGFLQVKRKYMRYSLLNVKIDVKITKANY